MITEIPVAELDTPAKGVDFLAELDRQEAEQEAALEATKKLRHQLEYEVLVELFDRFEQPEAVSNSGASAKKSLSIYGSLPKVSEKDTPEEARENKRRREAAIALAVEYGWQPFIKTEVTGSWDKGDREKALAFYNYLRGDNSVVADITEGIHPMTLQAQVRKRIREGLKVDLTTLNVQAGPAVKLKKTKDKK